MPVYNGMPFLEEAMASILAQTYEDFELIVVDDGSTDTTLAHLNGYRDARVRIISLNHQGIVAALNAGLNIAKGRLIARMDADDRSYPERLERQVRGLEARPELGLLATGARHWGDTVEHAGFRAFVNWNNQLCDATTIYRSRFIESPLIHPTVMFRRELVTHFGGYRSGDFPEDYELWLRWLAAGVRMAKLDWIGLDWRERPSRLSRADQRYAVSAFYQLKARYLAAWLRDKGLQQDGVIIWGAGRVTRQRCQYLEEQGIPIHAFVDIDPKKVGNVLGGRPVWGPEQLPPAGERYLLSYVGSRGARDHIGAHLKSMGYQEETHFLFAA